MARYRNPYRVAVNLIIARIEAMARELEELAIVIEDFVWIDHEADYEYVVNEMRATVEQLKSLAKDIESLLHIEPPMKEVEP